MAASDLGPSPAFFPIKSGLEAGGRPVGDDGLQTYGGLLALARYVKIQVVPAIGGKIGLNEVRRRDDDEDDDVVDPERLRGSCGIFASLAWNFQLQAALCTRNPANTYVRRHRKCPRTCSACHEACPPYVVPCWQSYVCRHSTSLSLTGDTSLPQVELRVGDDAPARPVSEKKWLKETGMLPLAGDPSTSSYPNFDNRAVADGGCDSPTHFEGCHVYYIKVLLLFAVLLLLLLSGVPTSARQTCGTDVLFCTHPRF